MKRVPTVLTLLFRIQMHILVLTIINGTLKDPHTITFNEARTNCLDLVISDSDAHSGTHNNKWNS